MSGYEHIVLGLEPVSGPSAVCLTRSLRLNAWEAKAMITRVVEKLDTPLGLAFTYGLYIVGMGGLAWIAGEVLASN